MLFIGDVHGKFNEYLHLIKNCNESIQVGDFGLGFDKDTDDALKQIMPYFPKHKFIRGNHDNLAVCQDNSNWISDVSVDNGMFFLGGAWSIDHAYRTVGVDIWEDEELSTQALNYAIDQYEALKPNIMVTHDCPSSISVDAFKYVKLGGPNGKNYKTRTGEALEQMWQIHQPKLWIFGHWHHDLDIHVGNCRFICLDELSTVDIDLEYYNRV